MDKQNHFDFVTAIGLIALALVMMYDSYRMAVEVGGPLYASPGMLPMLLAILLLLASVLLFKRSLHEAGIRANALDFGAWLGGFVRSQMAREMLFGCALLATYTFVLAPRLPFWASTAAFMLAALLLLRAASAFKAAGITAIVVGAVYGVFRLIFHVPLP